jgi:hypothetical protein
METIGRTAQFWTIWRLDPPATAVPPHVTIAPMALRLLRGLVALLLVATVPLQGLAAVTAGLCVAMGHHGSDIASSHGHGDDADAGHRHGEGHDHSIMPVPNDVASSDDGGQGQSHCAPCVSCCAAAAITSHATLRLLDTAPEGAIAAKKYAIPGALPAELDRPPLAL